MPVNGAREDERRGGQRATLRLDPDASGADPVSYAIRHEPSHRVWLNRVGVTGSLFSVAMGLSVLLGRSRR